MSSITSPRPQVKANSFTRPTKTYDGHTLHEVEGRAVLEILSRAKPKFYVLTALASDFGSAYRLNKAAGAQVAASGESYDVLLDGVRSSCTCPGHTYTNGCLHLSALLALQGEGKLGAPAPKPATAPCVLDDL
ncbi:MAG TPA: hypothetical protein VFE78_27605 [Gemmataceae bacterium]|jgi:hypothetical protein|nr:hypothetical protein [Gemmataceae bacterium]